jgi:hypothetical protein
LIVNAAHAFSAFGVAFILGRALSEQAALAHLMFPGGAAKWALRRSEGQHRGSSCRSAGGYERMLAGNLMIRGTARAIVGAQASGDYPVKYARRSTGGQHQHHAGIDDIADPRRIPRTSRYAVQASAPGNIASASPKVPATGRGLVRLGM